MNIHDQSQPHFSENRQPVVVSSTQDLVNAIAAGYAPEQIQLRLPAAEIEQARAAGFDAGRAQGNADIEARLAQAREEGAREARKAMLQAADGGIPLDLRDAIAVAERERILSIQSMTEDGFERLANECIHSGATAEQFAVKFLLDKKDRGITMEMMRKGAPKAAGHGGKPGESYDMPGGGTSPTSVSRERLSEQAEEIFESRRAAMSAQRGQIPA